MSSHPRNRSVVVALALSLASAGSGAHVEASAPSPDPLSQSRLLADVRAYADVASTHLSGTPSEWRTQKWFRSQLAAAGVRVSDTAYTFLGFHPRKVALSIGGQRAITNAAAYFYSGRTTAHGRTARLV